MATPVRLLWMKQSRGWIERAIAAKLKRQLQQIIQSVMADAPDWSTAQQAGFDAAQLRQQ